MIAAWRVTETSYRRRALTIRCVPTKLGRLSWSQTGPCATVEERSHWWGAA